MLAFDVHHAWADFTAHYQATLRQGVTTVLGGSGEGKSTLLHLLGGHLHGSGHITFAGESFAHLPPYERPITALFQSDNLFPQLTVWQNVAIGLAPSLRLNAEQSLRVRQALEQTQLWHKQAQYPQALSGGQMQRVAIARVLVRRQPILLLDEPFAALDPGLREEMLDVVQEVTHRLGLTTVLVSHLPQEALVLGGDVLLIDGGQVRAHDSAQVLRLSNPPAAWSRYLGVSSVASQASSSASSAGSWASPAT